MTLTVKRLQWAIKSNDLAAVKRFLTRDPSLHNAPLGYHGNGPLTLAAECGHLEMAEWMIDNGSDVHQGGDGPLMRAALDGDRIPMMELLVAKGADVNAKWNGSYPIIFAPCETVDPRSLRWLLEHGANAENALDYLIGSYVRSPRLTECIAAFQGRGKSAYQELPGVMEAIQGDIPAMSLLLHRHPDLLSRTFPELNFGNTGTRRLLLTGGTLLHVAAEYGHVEMVRWLLDHGADINAAATAHSQTPIFHSATQFDDAGLEVTKLLAERGADLSLRLKLPGPYERLDEFVTCTPLEYAQQFPGTSSRTVEFLAAYRRAAR